MVGLSDLGVYHAPIQDPDENGARTSAKIAAKLNMKTSKLYRTPEEDNRRELSPINRKIMEGSEINSKQPNRKVGKVGN